jgi:hypothetical protein
MIKFIKTYFILPSVIKLMLTFMVIGDRFGEDDSLFKYLE